MHCMGDRPRVAVRNFALLFLIASATPAQSQVQGPAISRGNTVSSSMAMPAVMSLQVSPKAVLPTANETARDQLAALEAWNALDLLPTKNGFVRPLPIPLSPAPAIDRHEDSAGSWAKTASGQLVWATHIEVTGAFRLRLHLEKLSVPTGTRFVLKGGSGQPVGFGMELATGDALWTPSVAGSDVSLNVVLPEEWNSQQSPILTISEVLEIVPHDEYAKGTACLVDATCIQPGTFDVIAAVRSGIGHLQYVKDGSGYICSGGLLNDTVPTSFIPYLLTANHCISTQAVASTLEVFWDYFTATCFGTFPGLANLPRSNGATLLATGAGSDFTLVRLNSVPGIVSFWDGTPDRQA